MNAFSDMERRLLVALKSERPEKEVKGLLSDFEDALLGRESMPGEAFDFILLFMRTAPALQLSSAAYLFMMMHIEFYLLSSEQVHDFIEAVRDSKFMSGGSGEGALACADMLAKNLDPEIARALFKEAEFMGRSEFSGYGLNALRLRSLRSKQ